jgi:hypothetical protein
MWVCAYPPRWQHCSSCPNTCTCALQQCSMLRCIHGAVRGARLAAARPAGTHRHGGAPLCAASSAQAGTLIAHLNISGFQHCHRCAMHALRVGCHLLKAQRQRHVSAGSGTARVAALLCQSFAISRLDASRPSHARGKHACMPACGTCCAVVDFYQCVAGAQGGTCG